MSIHFVVLLPRGTGLPSARSWSDAATAAGRQLAFLRSFDPASNEGAVPVECDSVRAAFEFEPLPIAEYLADVRGDFRWLERFRLRRSFGMAASFSVHSRSDDLFAAGVAAAVLAVTVRGLLLDARTGHFIPADQALAWSTQLERPDPESLRRREATAAVVQRHVGMLLSDLGFSPLEEGPDPETRQEERWLVRAGTAFPHELVNVSVYSDGDESWLGVTFYGTPFEIEKLRREGLSGNIAGRSLFTYLFDVLERPFETILPKNIPVTEEFPSTSAARQLRKELEEAHRDVYSELRSSMKEDGEWWPGVP